MSLFSGLTPANAAVTGQATIEVPGFWQDAGNSLTRIAAPTPTVPSPADDNIQPGPGDDLSAPNATTVARLNRVVCVSSANVGYSNAGKETHMLPSALEYEATIEETTHLGEFAMILRMTLEYESAFPDEGMVVWLKKHQQFINDEKTSELLLIETAFEDFVQGRWVPITTDIRYAEEAEAIVQAVITSDSGQTAGRVTTEGAVKDAKLGPVGERGRIVLTYRCERLYSYAEMGLGGVASRQTLVPLALQLPWAAMDNPAVDCRLRASVRAPAGTSRLDPVSNVLAYRDLQRSLCGAESECAVLPMPSQTRDAEWSFARASLPPRPTMVLAWLSVPNIDDSWEKVELSLPKTTRARLMMPAGDSAPLLRVHQPGGFLSHLVRCQVDTEAPARRPGTKRVHADITISDASGSTGMSCNRAGACRTVRQCFNLHEERRVLKRLEGIPKLRCAGVLLDDDVWVQQFVVFDHGVRSQFSIEARVGDLDASTVEALCKVLVDGSTEAAAALERAGKQDLLKRWRSALESLRALTAGGTTSFVAGATQARTAYMENVKRKFPGAEFTAYVNFDTDGGNNCGPCYDAIAKLVEDADVVQGHVLGVGSWVDQDCAAKVAKLLKGTVSLSLSFPEDAAADELFRQDMGRWIKALRTCPVSVKVSAGSVKWTARHGDRFENGVECLCAEGEGLRFDQPDITELDHTKAVLRGLQAGMSTTLYLLSRLPIEQLVSALAISVDGEKAQVSAGPEQLTGVALGHRWLSVLGSDALPDVAANRSSLCGRLRSRLEDDVSFSWNLPTKSGSTAAVGRAKTQARPPVRAEQQPEAPTAPALERQWVVRRDDIVFGGPPSGLFGKGGLVGGGFGGGAKGFGAGLFFGAPTPTKCSAPAKGPMTAMQVSCPPVAAFASMATQASPPVAAFAPMAMQAAPPPDARRCARAKESKRAPAAGRPMGRAQRFDHSEDESGDAPDGPATPSKLLQASGHMQFGTRESAREAVVRGVRALKVLANSSVSGLSPLQAVGVEDPLVGDILGSRTATPKGPLAVHTGYVCDASGVNPIVGRRFKATDQFDCDISEACRKACNLAGGGGFRPIPSSAVAMRWALSAILSWWPLVWPRRVDLFQAAQPDLRNLSTANLCQAIINLPDDVQSSDLV